MLKIGECLLDIGRHGIVTDGELTRLEPRDFVVLMELVEKSPNLVSTRALLSRAWHSKAVGDNVLHQSVARLRRALGDNAKKPIYIQTLPKLGYQFIAPVTRLSSDADPGAELSPVAILPFHDYSNEKNASYLVDGLSFELSHQFMQADAQVISLDRAARMQRRGFTDVAVGGRVGAKVVLHGSVMVAEGRIRVVAMLSSVARDQHLWSERYDYQVEHLFDLHITIAEAIVSDIFARFDTAPRTSRAARPPMPVARGRSSALRALDSE